MHVSRRAPQRDHGTQPYASAKLNAWNPKFVPKEVWENEREGFVEVELSSNDHRMTVGIRPSELIMMLTAVPPEVIRESFVRFADEFSDEIRGDQTMIQPECAVTRNRGQSPRDGVADCLLFSVADGRIDRKIQRFEGLCPVVDAPFGPLATSSTGGGAALTSG